MLLRLACSSAMASKPKFYAVKKGHNPGIYTSWKDCSNQVQGYKGNLFKSFQSRTEAEQYMGDFAASASGPTMLHVPAMSESEQRRQKFPKVVRIKRKLSRSISPTEARPSTATEEDVYQVEYDGASKSNPGPAGAGALVRRPDGTVVCELREGLGSTTNNVAEYRAFILGLRGALDRGIYRVQVQGDSKLVCEQVLGRWKVNQPTLAILCKEAQQLIQNFSEFSIRHVDREFNAAADQLANEAVSLPETKFVSSFNSTELQGLGMGDAATLGDLHWRQGRGRITYGAFNFLQTSQLRLASKSYCLGFRTPSMAGAQWLRNIFSPFKGNRVIILVARPRVYYACPVWQIGHLSKNSIFKVQNSTTRDLFFLCSLYVFIISSLSLSVPPLFSLAALSRDSQSIKFLATKLVVRVGSQEGDALSARQ